MILTPQQVRLLEVLHAHRGEGGVQLWLLAHEMDTSKAQADRQGHALAREHLVERHRLIDVVAYSITATGSRALNQGG